MSEESLANMKTETNKVEHKIEKNWRKVGNAGQKRKLKQNFNYCFQTDIR